MWSKWEHIWGSCSIDYWFSEQFSGVTASAARGHVKRSLSKQLLWCIQCIYSGFDSSMKTVIDCFNIKTCIVTGGGLVLCVTVWHTCTLGSNITWHAELKIFFPAMKLDVSTSLGCGSVWSNYIYYPPFCFWECPNFAFVKQRWKETTILVMWNGQVHWGVFKYK